jgi:hypothetical protein
MMESTHMTANASRLGLDCRVFVRRLAGLLVAIAIFCLASAPARADDIVSVTVPTVSFIGANLCGPANNSPCVGSLSGSFEWDNTTGSVVPGTAHIATAGPLGTFSFLQSFFVPLGPSGELVGSMWTNSAGDELTADLFALSTGLTPGTYPIIGPLAPGDAGVGLGCNEAPIDQTCFTDFLNPFSQELAPTPMTVSAVAVPEGPTLFMVILGLLPSLWGYRRLNGDAKTT